MPLTRAPLLPLAAMALGLTGTALMAQPGPWGGPGWGMSARQIDPAVESRIEVARFRAEGDAAAALGSGPLGVIAMPGGDAADPRLGAVFEAAIEGQLLNAGYRAAAAGESGGHVAEVRIVRSEAAPAEEKGNPVSGQASFGVSNRGSMMGLAVHVDGSKPRRALIETRVETRIRDKASGAVLWEGRARMYSREGDAKWTDDAIAARLARALFGGFPERLGEYRERR
ncbi:MAG: hypothetical protein GXC70_06505 [Sphingomonadaceae bacterium]|nr:hypothetical protein [Sphingomonadaceae bacterium]